MKKHLLTYGKALGFFITWLLTVIIMAIPAVGEPSFFYGHAVYLRLWWEFLPLLGVLLATGFFLWAVEKRKITVAIWRNPLKNIAYGLLLGFIWLGSVVGFLYLVGVFSFGDKNNVSHMPIWFTSVLLNVIMQNLLVRGYIFSLFREKYNTIVAIILTTVLFTAMHAGAFEAGIVAVCNIVTMSIFVSLLLIYTESLLAPIITHFIWNSIGCLILGVVSMADDYPNLLNCSLSGTTLISGGVFGIEGSIVVFVMNVLLITFMSYLIKKRPKHCIYDHSD